MRKIFYLAIFTAIVWSCSSPKPQSDRPDIIPLPAKYEMKGGHFNISGRTDILVNSSDEKVMNVAAQLATRLSSFTGKTLAVDQSEEPSRNSIFLGIDNSLANELGREGYTLSVKSSGVEIRAAQANGLFYGLQTLYQLLPPQVFNSPDSLHGKGVELTVPCIEITDFPQFAWRGMHLDVSRHFFPKEFIKKYIDLIAMNKMNVFHWHLTDDNGWRIQIDKYPLLTEVAAWRADREGVPWNECQPQQPGEKATYGGFYTKDDIREIVKYAGERFVTIVPEIEMPGHTSEVFAAYPEYSCSGKKLTVQTGSYWPNTDVFCAGNDGTFTFIENVLDEVMELFPSEYIHIGGDEVDKTAWKSCPKCQARIRNEKLSGVDELQSYFVKRIEKYVNSKGRKVIGWDEILEGGLAPEATVMSWRGFAGGMEAASQGHQVIMCPGTYCYFDHYQADPDFQPPAIGGFTTVEKVYSFNPVPNELDDSARSLILGAQGNLWTEYISTPEHAEYMALPRMSALAEVVWTPGSKKNWEDFKDRLLTQFKRFDNMNVNYCKGSGKVEVRARFNQDEKPYALQLETEVPNTTIFYTLNGNMPDNRSYQYKAPITLDHSVTLKAIAYGQDNQKLEQPAEYTIDYHRIIGRPVSYQIPYSEQYPGNGITTLDDGIRGSLNYNDGQWQGFHGDNMDVIFDLGDNFAFTSIKATFLLDQKKWIFIPEKVNYYVSENGDQFQKITEVSHKIPLDSPVPLTNDFTLKLNRPMKVRFLRLEAVNIGVCPDWHPGKGQKAWLFADEIEVK